VRVNRLLLNNLDVRGVGWGAYLMGRPGAMREQWAELLPMMASGVVDPPIGQTFEFDEMPVALTEMAERRTRGKSVLRV
jgi:NADPH2:quinone reductase